MRNLNCLLLLGVAAASACTAQTPTTRFTTEQVANARTMLSDIDEAVSAEYRPSSRIDAAYRQRIAEVSKQLGQAKSLNDANALIADTFAALDARIRIRPPRRSVRVDYGWDWRIMGDGAYVTHLDSDGAAGKSGLKLGDRILTVEDVALNRSTSQQIYYAMYTLAPRPGLNLIVQSPDGAPKRLAIPSTFRQQRNNLDHGPTPLEYQRKEEFRNINNHLHRAGPVLVWRADELRREIDTVSAGLKAARDATGLILDLRGQNVVRHETAMRLLSGLFTESFDAGRITREGLDERLRVSGSSKAFAGTVLVLVDSTTANYAEVVARVIQQKKRGVIIGDRTMGRVFEHQTFGHARGAAFNFNVSGVTVPVGEIILADGSSLDGTGVTPDYLLLPNQADIAGRRDVVLSKALAMLKQDVPPEEAYKFFRTEPDDDETN